MAGACRRAKNLARRTCDVGGANAAARTILPNLRRSASLLRITYTTTLAAAPNLRTRAAELSASNLLARASVIAPFFTSRTGLSLTFTLTRLWVLLKAIRTYRISAFTCASCSIESLKSWIAPGIQLVGALACANWVAHPLFETILARRFASKALTITFSVVIVSCWVAFVAFCGILNYFENQGSWRIGIVIYNNNSQIIYSASQIDFVCEGL